MKPKEIRFWDLPDSARFILNQNFSLILFDNAAKGDYYSLANKLNISYPYIHHLRRSLYSIPKNMLIRISELAGENLVKIEGNISLIKTRSGISFKGNFPIKSNLLISSLVGHVFGDGCIDSKKRQFEYSNTNSNLLSEVESEVKSIFGIGPIRKTNTRIVYPSIIGDVLLVFGAPLAPKINSKNIVPEWITQGPDSFKKAFLKAIFNDDGSVMFSKSYNAKGINLYQTRHVSKKRYLKTLLYQTKILLEEFDIRCGNPLVARKYQKSDGTHIVMYINITDYTSISKFRKTISLTEGNKQKRLERLLSRKTYYKKFDEKMLEDSIVKHIKTNHLSTSDISSKLGTNNQRILKKLNRLEKSGALEKVGRVEPNRAFIWEEKGGIMK